MRVCAGPAFRARLVSYPTDLDWGSEAVGCCGKQHAGGRRIVVEVASLLVKKRRRRVQGLHEGREGVVWAIAWDVIYNFKIGNV